VNRVPVGDLNEVAAEAILIDIDSLTCRHANL